ncbi:relaxase/mobilization nuclease [Prevotella dentalis DSM 3688]|uniref:Relaxase/mobilization nuclease n=1 Tax=Prevotella dentalis (strain ATCC 49559 / DSM 3688 / JCM 13448 / NCTC 12043 / ES 2772) TaxID=908937 RepID=F9D724_PREDD|nr:relaxase/mobilization nuclease domain-containing protein [Prevotella dentalis]AGB29666.1 relaxase/mobilization nuclease [Prevotella dentalis DSM 3688]EGQ11810.1 relaxase/mobilization nuclease domain protein [Prevotella dentalis DSM 3688]
MIATILPSSTTFHAVGYNERKVAKGQAVLLEMKNFGYVGAIDGYSPEQLQQYLIDYSARNGHIRKAQFHVAISCRGHEYSQEQLLDIAHQYLQEMGYNEEGQPLLIYAHHDTDNNHLHIVTSRVAPDGHKINHNHERIRSQEAINKIVGEDEELRGDLFLKEALDYKFNSLTQFKAILEASGYECFERGGHLEIARGGRVRTKIGIEDLTARFAIIDEKETYRRRRQLGAILRKYRNMVADRSELADIMQKKFGVSLVFFGSKDKPYGYMIVDHHKQAVYKGGSILSIKQLQHFMSEEERINKVELFVDAMLEENPRMIAYELNRMLWRQYGTRIAKGRFKLYGGREVALSDSVQKVLKFNYMLRRVQDFRPVNETERDILCRIWKIENPHLIHIEPHGILNNGFAVEVLNNLATSTEKQDLGAALKTNHLAIFRQGDQYYCVDFSHKCIFNLASLGIDFKALLPALQELQPVSVQSLHRSNGILKNVLSHHTSTSDRNAEWEVGGNGGYEVDGEWKLKR